MCVCFYCIRSIDSSQNLVYDKVSLRRYELKKFFQKQLGHIWAGIIIWLPITVIMIIGMWIFKNLDGVGQYFFDFLPFGGSLPSGVGFFVILALLYISGILLEKTRIKRFAAKIPVLGVFLSHDGKTMSLEKLFKLQPCLFLYSPTCPSYGFVLSEEKTTVDGKPFSTMLNVYFPNVPTLIMGQVFLVRKETVVLLDNSPGELINLLLYASKSPSSIKYLPWKNETKEEFEERIKKFGLTV